MCFVLLDSQKVTHSAQGHSVKLFSGITANIPPHKSWAPSELSENTYFRSEKFNAGSLEDLFPCRDNAFELVNKNCLNSVESILSYCCTLHFAVLCYKSNSSLQVTIYSDYITSKGDVTEQRPLAVISQYITTCRELLLSFAVLQSWLSFFLLYSAVI